MSPWWFKTDPLHKHREGTYVVAPHKGSIFSFTRQTVVCCYIVVQGLIYQTLISEFGGLLIEQQPHREQ